MQPLTRRQLGPTVNFHNNIGVAKTRTVGREIVTELLIVVALICLNGLFALSELAVVSARHPRLKALAASGRHGANRALELASDPGRFLSAVQIGITLIGIINGAYSGETFGVQMTISARHA